MRAASLVLAAFFVATACRRQPAGTSGSTADVQGRVIAADGRAPSGVQVVLERDSTAGPVVVATTRTDPARGFAFAGIRPARYLLRALAPGYATAAVPIEPAAGERLATVLRLEPEQTLEGVVQDGQGRALVDALIVAWPRGQRAGVVRARSTADGRFALTSLGRGTWSLLVEAPGFGVLQIDQVLVPTRPIVLRLEGEGRVLRGLVIAADGLPRPGARVMLGGPHLRSPRQAMTDAKGAFLFAGLGSGLYTVRASHEKLASVSVAHVIDTAGSGVSPVRLKLEPGAFVSGRVVDDTGRALPAAVVELAALPADDLPELARTDAGGEFAIGPVTPARYQLQARLPDHVQLASPELRLRADANTTVEVRIERAGRVSGRVVDLRGSPLAGASVTAVGLGAGADELAVLAGVLPLAAEAADLPAQALVRRGRARIGSTDSRGRFRLDEVPPGRSRIEISHPEVLPLTREPIFLGPGDAQDLGELVLHAGVQISGRVLDEEGRPLEDVRVEGRALGSRPRPALRVTSDKDGRFALRAPAGEYTLVALAPGWAIKETSKVRAEPGADPPPLDLRLLRADATLEGQVQDAARNGVSRATVMALAPPPDFGAAAGAPFRPRSNAEAARISGESVPLANGVTDASGRFRLVGLPRGKIVLEVRHSEWPAAAIVAEVGASVSVQLARPGGIEGDIRDRSSGAFVARYELEAVGPQGRTPERIRTEGAGFVMLGLQPGRWALRVKSPGFAPAQREVDVPSGPSRREPSLKNIRIDLSRGGP